MHRSFLAPAAAAAALLLTPALASAAPAGTISLDGPAKYSWTGGPGNGLLPDVVDLVGVGPVSSSKFKCGDPTYDCQDTLIKVDSPGDLTFDLHGDSGSPTDTSADPEDPVFGDKVRLDLDAFLYASDASGTIGDEVANSTTPYGEESAVASAVEPGYYVARVVFYQAVNATFHASATIAEPAPEDSGDGF
jgi:hypothetical protein